MKQWEEYVKLDGRIQNYGAELVCVYDLKCLTWYIERRG